MTPRTYELLAPIVTIASLTAISFVPLMGIHIAQADEVAAKKRAALERRVNKQHEQMQRYEKFIVNCLSGRNLLVDGTDAVMCIRI